MAQYIQFRHMSGFAAYFQGLPQFLYACRFQQIVSNKRRPCQLFAVFMALQTLLTWRLLFDKILVFQGCKLYCFLGDQGFRNAEPSGQFFDPLPEHIAAGKVETRINTGCFFAQNVLHHAELFEAVLPVPA